MNLRPLLLVALAVGVVRTGFVLECCYLAALWHPVALLIVFGGSLLATLVQIPAAQYRPLLGLLSWLLSPPYFSLDVLLGKLTVSGNALRRDGPQALEKVATAETDPVL